MSASTLQCPQCGQPIAARAAAGQLLQCPNCRKVFPAPAGSTYQPAAQPRQQQSTGTPPAYPQSASYPATNQSARVIRSNKPATISFVCGILFFALISLHLILLATEASSEIVTMVLGVLALITPILALIFGFVGLRRARDRRAGGKGKAIAGTSLGGVAVLMVILGVTVALPRAREGVNRVKCAANMRIIGQAMMMYSNVNHGNYPPGLQDILRTQEIGVQCFVCPSTSDTPADGATFDQKLATLSTGGHQSYIYLGAGKTPVVPPNFVLLYEPMTDHGDGFNALFGDGRVEFVSGAKVPRVHAELKAGQNPPPSLDRS